MLGLRIRFWWNPIGVPSRQVLQSANGFRVKPCSTSPSLNTLTTLIPCANFLPTHHNNSVPSSLQSAHVSGLDDALVNYVFGRKKATDVAHIVWRNVVQKGDTVVDATCGNGYDTLAMLKMIADDSRKGCVYGFDIQPEAIVSTSSLLDSNVNQKQQVQLYNISHSRMDEVIPSDTAVRLVAFNLGYLPGTDKRIITMPETTVLALEAAKKLLMSGGVISLVVYIGHLGGREELEAIEAFASSQLPVDSWTCCKLQALNRPLAPVLIFMFKR